MCIELTQGILHERNSKINWKDALLGKPVRFFSDFQKAIYILLIHTLSRILHKDEKLRISRKLDLFRILGSNP